MPWVYLIIAGLLEVIWAATMKQSYGFTRLVPSLITLVGMVGSVGFLALAMRGLPLSTAYMIWTGIGAVGAFFVGTIFLGEPVSITRVAAATMIVAGLLTLKMAQG